MNAEYAVATTGDNFSQMFAAMDDEYMRGRAADVKDISERLITILSGKSQSGVSADEPVIVVALDLAPSETVQMDKEKVLSFVTVEGSLNSHTAILARTMSIPSLIGTDMPLDDTVDGKLGIVDGENGCIYVDPDEETIKIMTKKKEEDDNKKLLLQKLKGRENVTLDGQKVKLYANIGNIKDLALVLQNDASGIGLFRSEFIYLDKDDYPTEEEQFTIYKTVVETMAGKQVIIRTLDIGADKQCDYFNMDKEANPALGYRAIRICLTRPEVFKTQLRALFRASAFGNLAIDRQNPKLDKFYDAHHPAILEMIRMVVENAHKEGIWAGICGELGADTELTRDFLAMGVDELSVSPGSVLPIRKIIVETDVKEYIKNNGAK